MTNELISKNEAIDIATKRGHKERLDDFTISDAILEDGVWMVILDHNEHILGVPSYTVINVNAKTGEVKLASDS